MSDRQATDAYNTIPILDRLNYSTWSKTMQLYLMSKNLWDVLAYRPPPKTETNIPEFADSDEDIAVKLEPETRAEKEKSVQRELWIIRNSQASLAILRKLDKPRMIQYQSISIARELWKRIKLDFGHIPSSTIFTRQENYDKQMWNPEEKLMEYIVEKSHLYNFYCEISDDITKELAAGEDSIKTAELKHIHSIIRGMDTHPDLQVIQTEVSMMEEAVDKRSLTHNDFIDAMK